jgi:hypothetical protein
MKINFLHVFLVFVGIWIIQNSNTFIAYGLHDDAQGEFSKFVYKGALSHCDILNYAGHLRYSGEHPSLLRPDGLIKENKELLFADGNILNVYAGWVLKLVKNIDLVPVVGSILPLFLSVLLIFKISKRLFGENKLLFQIGLSVILLLANFDDFLGIGKFIQGFILHAKEMDDTMPLGYNSRFPYGQFSNVIFVYWIYTLIEWLFDKSSKNQILLAVSIILCHYTYFYYWSYALPVTVGCVFFTQSKPKTYLTLTAVYLIGTLHYWINFFEFNALDFAAEYLERVKGPQYFSYVWILIIGLISGYSVFLKNKKLGLLLYILPTICLLILKKINYIFPVGNLQLILSLDVCVVLLLALVYAIIKIDFTKLELINVFNFYLTFILMSLAYIIGYNVQPYHWIYTTYFTIMAICTIGFLKQFLPSEIFYKFLKGSIVVVVVVGGLNSYRFADRNVMFWNLSEDDEAVILFLNEQDHRPIIGGNNIMPLITFTAHSNAYLYSGSTCHSRSRSHELYYRFINSYKSLGYSDSLIVKEYQKYQKHTDYWEIYHGYDEEKRIQLGQEFPDNLTLAAEVLHHYFLNFEERIPELQKELKLHDVDEYDLEWNYLIIYKPTLETEFDYVGKDVVLDNKTYAVIKVSEPTAID